MLRRLSQCAVALYTAANMLAGCGAFRQAQGDAWQAQGGMPPIGAQSAALQGSMRQDVKGRNLLYASTLGDEPVYIYAYPGGKMVGLLTGPVGPRGMCVDRSSDIFIPFIYIPGGIYEFAHGGGSPIAYLGSIYEPNSCSVDPKTGNLAVVGGASFYPGLVIYRYKGKRFGFARSYMLSSMMSSAFCGYDDRGDLFVDGKDSSGAFVLAELSKGSANFTTLSVNQSIKAPGQVQWDGKHMAIGDTGVSPSVIYQFDISGSSATKVGSTTLKNSKTVEQFWIQHGKVIAPDPKRSCGGTRTGCIAIYPYPSGGSEVKIIELTGAYGATVSLAP